jgi:hypothetical protein
MGEWLKPAVLKTVSGVTRSGVRIPLPPPLYLFYNQLVRMYFTRHCGGIATRSCAEGPSGWGRGRSSVNSVNKVWLGRFFVPLHRSKPEQNSSFPLLPLFSVAYPPYCPVYWSSKFIRNREIRMGPQSQKSCDTPAVCESLDAAHPHSYRANEYSTVLLVLLSISFSFFPVAVAVQFGRVPHSIANTPDSTVVVILTTRPSLLRSAPRGKLSGCLSHRAT